jgi:hypothetical protein
MATPANSSVGAIANHRKRFMGSSSSFFLLRQARDQVLQGTGYGASRSEDI